MRCAIAGLEHGGAREQGERALLGGGGGDERGGHFHCDLRRFAGLLAHVETDPARLRAVRLVFPYHRVARARGRAPVDVARVITGAVSAKAPILTARAERTPRGEA